MKSYEEEEAKDINFENIVNRISELYPNLIPSPIDMGDLSWKDERALLRKRKEIFVDITTIYRVHNSIPIEEASTIEIDEIESSMVNNLLREDVQEALNILSEREREVLERRYGLAGLHLQSLEDMSREFGVTRTRVQQIEDKALRKLRHPNHNHKLKCYIDDYSGARAPREFSDTKEILQEEIVEEKPQAAEASTKRKEFEKPVKIWDSNYLLEYLRALTRRENFVLNYSEYPDQLTLDETTFSFLKRASQLGETFSPGIMLSLLENTKTPIPYWDNEILWLRGFPRTRRLYAPRSGTQVVNNLGYIRRAYVSDMPYLHPIDVYYLVNDTAALTGRVSEKGLILAFKSRETPEALHESDMRNFEMAWYGINQTPRWNLSEYLRVSQQLSLLRGSVGTDTLNRYMAIGYNLVLYRSSLNSPKLDRIEF